MIRRVLRRAYAEYRVRRDPVGYARDLGVTIGSDCWLIATGVATWGSEPYLITLGNRVLVAAGVRFVTHDGAVWPLRRRYPDIDLCGPIVLGDDVFIGINSILLPNVTVGAESAIGAGTVVNRSIPPRSIVAGVPGRVLCTIDEYYEKHREDLVNLKGLSPPERQQRLLRRLDVPER